MWVLEMELGLELELEFESGCCLELEFESGCWLEGGCGLVWATVLEF